MTRRAETLLACAALSLCATACGAVVAPPVPWNAARIAWQSFDAAVARAEVERKPLCLVFYANWCEPCEAYSHLFEDPRVVAEARDFIMVRVNVDEQPDLAQRLRVDGGYTPRTFFFTPGGVLMKGVHAPRWTARYNYSHEDPAPLLAGMAAARAFARASSARPGEDPSAVPAADVCAAKADESTCAACAKAHCCAELVACVNEAACWLLPGCLSTQCAGPCPKTAALRSATRTVNSSIEIGAAGDEITEGPSKRWDFCGWPRPDGADAGAL